MNLFIKLLLATFPFVVAATLFWPAGRHGDVDSPQNHISQEPLLKTSKIIENDKPRLDTVKHRTLFSEPLDSASSSIYRWVDDSGHVHFSDRPPVETAARYTPKELGFISVSDDIKQRIAIAESNAVTQKNTEASKGASGNRRIRKAKKYRFSNVSAGQKHGYVELSGRISGGVPCRQLRVTVLAKSDTHRTVRGSDDLRMSGSGSRLFEIKINSNWNGGGKRRPQWEIKQIETICLVP